MVERTVYVLVVGKDAALHTEVSSAVDALPRTGTVVLRAANLRDGVEVARNRNPDVVVLELDAKSEEIHGFVKDVEHVSPETFVVGAYRVSVGDEGAGDGQLLVTAMRNRVRDFLRRPVSSNELQEVMDRNMGAAPEARPS